MNAVMLWIREQWAEYNSKPHGRQCAMFPQRKMVTLKGYSIFILPSNYLVLGFMLLIPLSTSHPLSHAVDKNSKQALYPLTTLFSSRALHRIKGKLSSSEIILEPWKQKHHFPVRFSSSNSVAATWQNTVMADGKEGTCAPMFAAGWPLAG